MFRLQDSRDHLKSSLDSLVETVKASDTQYFSILDSSKEIKRRHDPHWPFNVRGSNLTDPNTANRWDECKSLLMRKG